MTSRGGLSTTVVLLAVIFLAGVLYLNYVPGPEDTIRSFQNAVNTADLVAAVNCMDPQMQREFEAMDNVASGLFGAVSGVNISASDFFTVVSVIGKTEGWENDQYIYQVSGVEYSGGFYETLKNSFRIENEAVARIFADGAKAHVVKKKDSIYSDEGYVYVEEEYIYLNNYGLQGWKINADANNIEWW